MAVPPVELVDSVDATAVPAVGEPCVVVKLGEMVLKGRNRGWFERLLRANLHAATADLGGVRVRIRGGVVLLDPTPGVDVRELARRVARVAGVVWVHPAVRVAKTPDAAADAVLAVLGPHPTGSFAVRVRRRDKRFPMSSAELAAFLGARIQDVHGLPVDLSRPDLELRVEVDQTGVLVFTDALPGPGGLPVGASGRALVLLSGGIDSAVAASRMIRRGLACSFVHFSGMPHTGPESVYKAYGLARALNRYQHPPGRLWVVPFGRAQERLAAAGADELLIVAQRRLMLQTAERIAAREGLQALIVGDSLGQVSSQTLPNLAATGDAVTLPLLRPLLGFDKTEIMNEARRLGTLELSELPDEDCCTRLLPPAVTTHADLSRLHDLERRVDAAALADTLAGTARLYRPDPEVSTDRVSALGRAG